ncbi:MAG: MFS transporter [Acidimicrobiales bacterium]
MTDVTDTTPRRRVYTGWRIVGANSVVWSLQSMIWVQGYGNMAVELRDQFGWSKSFLSFVYAGTRAETAIFGPIQGRAIGTRGIKTVMRTGAVLGLVGFLAIAWADTRAEFVVAMLILALAMSLIGFLTITSATVRWFERRRARAMSILTMGFAFGGFCAPILVWGFDRIGWRPTIIIAGSILSCAAWWAAAIANRTPDDVDEPMDGLQADDADVAPKAEGVTDRHYTASEAMRTRGFWMISLGHGAALLVVSSSMAHLALYLTEDRDYSAGRAALVAGIVPLFQIVGTALGGFLGDRMNKRLIAGVAMLMHGAALIILVWVDHVAAVGAFVVLHGVAWGVRGPQMQAIRADYFGSTAFASIMGWSQIIVTMGSIAGPVLAGVLADSTGDYQLGFTILGIAAAFGVVFWILAAPPAPDDDRATIA